MKPSEIVEPDGPGHGHPRRQGGHDRLATFTEPDNITTPTQDLDRSTRYEYFAATHQLKKVTPPVVTPLAGSVAPGPQSFTYDGFGRLKTATSAKNVVTTYAYDKLDRVTSQSFSGGTATVSFLYDAHGNVYRRTDASGTTNYDFDAANRLLSKALPGGAGTLSYTYDAASNLTSATGAGGTTTYHYDKLNRLHQVTEPAPNARKDVFAYNGAGQRTDTWYNTGADVAYDLSGNNIVAGAFTLISRLWMTSLPAPSMLEVPRRVLLMLSELSTLHELQRTRPGQLR